LKIARFRRVLRWRAGYESAKQTENTPHGIFS
jgi:hypothetical protein